MTSSNALIWGDAFEHLETLSLWLDGHPGRMTLLDPDYDWSEKKQQRLHREIVQHSGTCFVFSKPENPWPHLPDQHLYWIKPRRTVNPQRTYARLVEKIGLFSGKVWNNKRHWSQYYNAMFDLIEEETIHPHQKPKSLIRRFILNHTRPGYDVLDLFSGSGTGSLAAMSTGRNSLAFEIKREYVVASLARIFSTEPGVISAILPEEPPAWVHLQGPCTDFPPLYVDSPLIIMGEQDLPDRDDPYEFFERIQGPSPKPRKKISKENYRAALSGALVRGAKENASIINRVIKLFGILPNWDTKTNRKILRFLLEQQAKGNNIETFAAWWKDEDWRGKKGQPPTTVQIKELWPKAFQTEGGGKDDGLESILG